MSYARWAEDCNVYVYESAGGGVVCHGCGRGRDFHTDDTAQMVAHLEMHRDSGWLVPQDVIDSVAIREQR